jgi:histidine ammonia-lyase
MSSAATIAGLLEGSEIGRSHEDDFIHAVQDAYSLRCAPQVHGAVWDTIAHAEGVFSRELGAVVDNPIVFPDTGELISAGNFHGQPLAFALDFLTIAVTELANISERRTDRLLDPERSSGLPAFLSPKPGINSGYMLLQYTAAALVAECRVLSHPASVESIPTSGSQEDHVSMGWGAGRKLWRVLDDIRRVLAIEILCAVQGIEYRKPLEPSLRVATIVRRVREIVPPLEDDRVLSDEIEAVADLIREGHLTR